MGMDVPCSREAPCHWFLPEAAGMPRSRAAWRRQSQPCRPCAGPSGGCPCSLLCFALPHITACLSVLQPREAAAVSLVLHYRVAFIPLSAVETLCAWKEECFCYSPRCEVASHLQPVPLSNAGGRDEPLSCEAVRSRGEQQILKLGRSFPSGS